MKKLKMIVTSVVVLAIVGSAFAFNAKKISAFCTSGTLTSTKTCSQITQIPTKRDSGTPNAYYIVDWDGTTCNGQSCTVSAHFVQD